MNFNRILLTGSLGFIGGHIKNYLESLGYDIICIDIAEELTPYSSVSTFSNHLEENDLTADNSIVLHFGANSDASSKDFNSFQLQNIEYSRILFESSFRRNIHVIFASSAAVYGSTFSFPDISNSNNLLPYARSKLTSESDLASFKNRFGGSATVLRLFNVYGPNEVSKSSMMSIPSRFILDAKSKRKIEIWDLHNSKWSGGKQQRDFISISHLIGVISEIIAAPKQFEGTFDLGSGTSRTFIDIAEIVKQLTFCDINFIKPPVTYNKSGYQTFTRAGLYAQNIGEMLAPSPFHESINDLFLSY